MSRIFHIFAAKDIEMKLLVTIILFLSTHLLVWSQVYGIELPDATQRVEALKTSNRLIKNIAADFVMEKKTTMMSGSVRTNGKMEYCKADERLSLTYNGTKGDGIVIEGDKISIITAGKRTTVDAEKDRTIAQMLKMIKSSITGDFTALSDNMNLKYYENSELFTVVMEPKNARVRKRYMRQIVLRFNNDNSLHTMRMEEGGDGSNYTEYTYTNQTITK